MNEIALHIDYLLHSHDCIIVPSLGGFVVNTTDVERNGLWGLDAPTFELLFNNKLTYNDGLLAESIMKTDNVSYQVAIRDIEAACEELKSRLTKGEEVEWDNLGIFKTDKENNVIFLPNKDYVRPQFFGLTNARFKPTVMSVTSSDDKAIPVKSIIRYVSTAIAAAVVLFFVVLSFNNNETKSQYAEMVSKPLIFSNNINASKSKTVEETKPTAYVANKNLTATANNSDKVIAQSTSSTNRYYIIVGVYEVRDIAEKRLSILKSEGFNLASMIERPRRLDVYSASFSNREEARNYLIKFQADNPQYKDAWILKR
jgi:hypothetical protein